MNRGSWHLRAGSVVFAWLLAVVAVALAHRFVPLAGWLLGGTVGVGTVVYALGIGPLVQLVLRCTPGRWLAASGWAHVVGDRAGRSDAEPAVATMSECPAPSTTPPQNPTLSPTQTQTY